MPKNIESKKILAAPLFLVGLFVLLLNDFYLKAAFHNFLTGKISDFAGLFVFPLFWTAFFPKRKLFIFVSTAVFFAFWKSPYSQELIRLWNDAGIFHIERVVDYGDLVALAVLPLAWIYAADFRPLRLPRNSQEFVLPALAVVSLFAFTATQQAEKPRQIEEFDETYKLPMSALDVAKKLQEIKTDEYSQSKNNRANAAWFTIALSQKICEGLPEVNFVVRDGENSGSQIELKHFYYQCDNKLADQRENLKRIFETEIINFLKNAQANQNVGL